MTQEEILTILKSFGPMEAKEIAKSGMISQSAAVHQLGKLRRWGDVWRMDGYGRKSGRLCLWGAM